MCSSLQPNRRNERPEQLRPFALHRKFRYVLQVNGPHFNRAFLAIDYGTRRIGLAKSDPMGMIASPIRAITVTSRSDAVAQVAALLADMSPDGLVIGYPLHESGETSDMCRSIDLFLGELQQAGWTGPIFRIDEFATSEIAREQLTPLKPKNRTRSSGRIDTMAAVILLRQFLDQLPSP